MNGDPSLWQPTYPFWAFSVYASSLVGGIAASLLTPLVASEAAGWGLETIVTLFRSEGAAGPGLVLALAMVAILTCVPPGMLSLFLIALTEIRFALHPLVGGAFFGLAAGWIGQSLTGALFGAIFGSVSVGGTAAMLGLHRHLSTRT